MTNPQTERLAADLAGIAKEDVTVEMISSRIYAFCSELGTLRLFAKYNSNGSIHNSKVRCGYSENLSRYYFSIDL